MIRTESFQLHQQTNFSFNETELSDYVSSDSSQLKVSYLGNMGFVVEYGDRTVLFDALHQKYKPAYLSPPAEVITELNDGNYQDFSAVEVCLISHKHKDHFSAELSRDFLSKNPQSIMIGSKQIKEEISSLGHTRDEIWLRCLKAIPYEFNVEKNEHSGIEIWSIRCDHSNPEWHGAIENVAHVADFGGFKILHLGDTSWGLAQKPMKLLKSQVGKIDLAIIPFWLLTQQSGRSKLKELIDPTYIIAAHVDPNHTDETRKEVHSYFPNAFVLKEIGEGFTISK